MDVLPILQHRRDRSNGRVEREARQMDMRYYGAIPFELKRLDGMPAFLYVKFLVSIQISSEGDEKKADHSSWFENIFGFQ